MELLQQSLFIPCGAHQLHVRHIQPRVAVHGEPILMVHGAIENGRIFYTESGKGLACFLDATVIRSMWPICGGGV